MGCKSTEVGERSIIGLDLIRGTSKKVDLIRKRLLIAHNRKKSYVDSLLEGDA